MGWRSWGKGAAGVGALLSSFAAGAMTGRLMLRHELAQAQEPPRAAPFASEEALVAANAERPAGGGLRLAGDMREAPATEPDFTLASADDHWPGEGAGWGKPLDDYAALQDEPEPSGKVAGL